MVLATSSVLDILRNVVTPEMDHSVIESSPFLWTARTVDTISTFIVGSVLCIFLYSTLCTATADASRFSLRIVGDELRRWTQALAVFTSLFVFSQFILMLSLTFNIWCLLPTSFSCDSIVLLMVSVYHLSKSLFYCVFITRLQVAFNASSLKYSAATIVSLYVFVLIYTIFVCIGSPFLIYGVWIVNDSVAWCHIHVDVTMWSSISIAVWIIMDVVISVILCWLFMRPIKHVVKMTDDLPNKRFVALYLKYGILTYISIIMNLVGLLFYLFDHLTILIEISAAINCICIVLMYARYQSVFDAFCGCCVVCCLRKNKKKRIVSDAEASNPKSHMELNALKSNLDEDDEENSDHL